MKKPLVFLLFILAFTARSQKVVKPAGNKKEEFTLTINKQPYKAFMAAFINKPAYKKMWADSVKKQPAEFWQQLKGKKLTATINLMVDVNEIGEVNVTDNSSSCPDEVGVQSLGNLVKTICSDLMKEIRKSGVVTPSYNKILRTYVGEIAEVKKEFTIIL